MYAIQLFIVDDGTETLILHFFVLWKNKTNISLKVQHLIAKWTPKQQKSIRVSKYLGYITLVAGQVFTASLKYYTFSL